MYFLYVVFRKPMCVYVKVVYAATVTPTTFLLDLHVITKYVHILDSTPDTLTANMYRRCIRDSVCGVFNFVVENTYNIFV